MKKAGHAYPKELEEELMKMQDKGVENLNHNELFKFATTMETLSRKENWDTSKVDAQERVKVKCACVHGSCRDGESVCDKCY